MHLRVLLRWPSPLGLVRKELICSERCRRLLVRLKSRLSAVLLLWVHVVLEEIGLHRLLPCHLHRLLHAVLVTLVAEVLVTAAVGLVRYWSEAELFLPRGLVDGVRALGVLASHDVTVALVGCLRAIVGLLLQLLEFADLFELRADSYF